MSFSFWKEEHSKRDCLQSQKKFGFYELIEFFPPEVKKANESEFKGDFAIVFVKTNWSGQSVYCLVFMSYG